MSKQFILTMAVLVCVTTMVAPVAAQVLVPPPSQLVTSPGVTVNNGPGDQTEPHVSGDLATYTDAVGVPRIRYYRFSTGADAAIPQGLAGDRDILSDVNGQRIVFSRIEADRTAIFVFDTAQPPSSTNPFEINPQPGALRFGPVIGGTTVAFQDANVGNGEIIIYDLATATTTRLTTNSMFDQNPGVSPDGNTVVWEQCSNPSPCDVMKSVRSGGAWSAPMLVANSSHNPDTDGTWIVYDSDRPSPTGRDIYFQPVGGGTERQLAIAGLDANPSIGQGVISFEGRPDAFSSADIFAYVIATSTLYQVTSTPTVDDTLNDVSVLSNGDIRVVWSANDGLAGDQNVYATTFTPAGGDFTFDAIAPLTITAGASASTTVTVNPVNGFSVAVNLSVSGQPAGVLVSLSPNPVTPSGGNSASSVLNVILSSFLVPTNFALTVTGTSGSLSHSATANVTVTAPLADLAISEFGPPTWPYGANMTYLLWVHNSGPAASNNVVVSDPLPAGTSFLGVSVSQGSCAAPPVGGTGTVRCNFGNLVSGASAGIAITVKLTASVGMTVTNRATVVGDSFDPNPANNSSSVSTNVSKALALVTLSNLTQTYDGTPKSVTVTTVPSGLAVVVRYNLPLTPPTNAGSYSVVATVNDPNYQGIAFGTLTINKAPATLALSNLNQTYNGRAKSATVTTTPAGLTGVSVTYNGSTTLPVSVGSYTVVTSLTNPNYMARNASGTLVIARASATVGANPAGKAYGSADPALSASETGFTIFDAARIALSATRALGENVGTYTIMPSASGAALANYNVTYNTANFTITAATPVFSVLSSSQSLAFGTSSISLSGKIAAGSVFPPGGEAVSITINATTVSAMIGGNGSFSSSFNTAAIPASTTPYSITYSYAGDGNFTSASDASTTLTVQPCVPGGPGGFSCTGNLTTVRHWHTATTLNDGTVLIAGGLSKYGDSTSVLSTAELYDSTGKFIRTSGNMNYPHAYHAATLLDNGMVLITGGVNGSGSPSPNAELYNPATGLFTPTQNGTSNVTTTLNIARDQHTATLLHCACPDDGKVLIAGGYNSTLGPLTSAELYNPVDGTFKTTTDAGGSLDLLTARYAHTATLLNSGAVLIAGGFNFLTGELNGAELYDPSNQTFRNTQGETCPTPKACLLVDTFLNSPRFLHTATLLNDGRVLFTAGAENAGIAPATTNSAELYDPVFGHFTLTKDVSNNVTTLITARYFHTATLLNNGMVLIAGGQVDPNGTPTPDTELYDPATGTFVSTGSLNTARHVQTATLLNNGSVLIGGGVVTTISPAPDPSTLLATASAELYHPTTLTPTNLVSIAVTPANQTISPGTTQRFIATDPNTGQQLASVTWSSSVNTVATISNDASNFGAAFAVGTGSVTIKACAGTTCGSTTLTVQ